MMVRLAHFSDIHLTAAPLGWRLADWFNKRLPGWVNLRFFGRGGRFRHADAVVQALVADVLERRPDRVIFSGDATALGFEPEFAWAAALLKVDHADMLPGLAVPGNHDYYTRFSATLGLFERYFAPWQTGERVDSAVYPFAQRVGNLWLVAVNSCTGNRWMWDAGGQVDAPQLDRLRRLFDRLEPGPRILVTHYPICLAHGECESAIHGLRNLHELIDVATRGGVVLWLHGHRHGPYHHERPPQAPFPVVCTGSATQAGLWCYHEYGIERGICRVTRRVYVPDERCFQDSKSFEIPLARAESSQ